jgi:transcriptional regulator with XRE-family HTH domain
MEGNMDAIKDISNILASNLRFLRINTKVKRYNGKTVYMSQTDLANLVGYKNAQQISKYELGVDQIKATKLYKISKIFDVSIEKLFQEDLPNTKFDKLIELNIYE